MRQLKFILFNHGKSKIIDHRDVRFFIKSNRSITFRNFAKNDQCLLFTQFSPMYERLEKVEPGGHICNLHFGYVT